MFKVIKNKGKMVEAHWLAEPDEVIERLVSEGRIKMVPNGFEVMTLEAINNGGSGEFITPDGYIKIDAAGAPYPNSAEFFNARHRHVEGCTYEQLPVPMDAWDVNEPMCDEVRFLIDNKGLVLNEADETHYFSAPLWGTVESAPKDAVVVFYSITRGDNGAIIDSDFNFVVRDIFNETYSIIE